MRDLDMALKCPHCNARVTKLKFDLLPAQNGRKEVTVVVFSCTICDAIITIVPNPDAVARRAALLISKATTKRRAAKESHSNAGPFSLFGPLAIVDR
jgi:hypothetical protein